jgi:hypothetical protein
MNMTEQMRAIARCGWGREFRIGATELTAPNRETNPGRDTLRMLARDHSQLVRWRWEKGAALLWVMERDMVASDRLGSGY